MEPLYYTRVSMAGWIFVAVTLGSFWETNSSEWARLTDAVRAGGSTAVAITALVIGIGAPPALGFLIERLLSTVLRVGRWTAVARRIPARIRPLAGTTFRSALVPMLREDDLPVPEITTRGLFRVIFYTYADDQFTLWRARKAAQGYASATAAIAGCLGLLVAGIGFDAWSLWVIIGTMVGAVILTIHSAENGLAASRSTVDWERTMGPIAARKYVEDLRVAYQRATTVTSLPDGMAARGKSHSRSFDSANAIDR